MIVFGSEDAIKMFHQSAAGDGNICTTQLGTLIDKSLLLKFARWIEDDFTVKHKSVKFWIVVDDNSEFNISPIAHGIKLICHDDDWEYLIHRLRPAFLAVRACYTGK